VEANLYLKYFDIKEYLIYLCELNNAYTKELKIVDEMKTAYYYLLSILISIIFSSCQLNNKSEQSSEGQVINSQVAQTDNNIDTSNIVLKVSCDSIDLRLYPSRKIYHQFRNESVQSVQSFGIYYDTAIVKLYKITNSQNEDILKIHFELTPYFVFGNWLSIRREFENVMDFSNCKGIQLQIKNEAPTDTKLRLTFCDVKNNEDINKHGAGEMWWFDFDDGILNNQGDWITLFAPFNKFFISEGSGARHNDYEMDISKAVAFEINVVSKKGKHSKGDILIKAIRMY